MADLTTIEWTATRRPDGTVLPGYSFNPWRGCQKVSPGCKFCYAEVQSKRNPSVLGEWGPGSARVIAAHKYWLKPERWNAEAQVAGIRRKVFCASIADVFEDRPDLHAPRLQLFDLVRRTPWLDWLFVTKRPENILPALDHAIEAVGAEMVSTELGSWLLSWRRGCPPTNLWLGTSVENQDMANERIPQLLAVPAAIRFLSCEPLLGPVDLPLAYCNNCFAFTKTREVNSGKDWGCASCGTYKGSYKGRAWKPPTKHCGIDWVIVGGESGAHARPMHPAWARSLREQCQAAGVAYFFKQWGEWGPAAYNSECMTRRLCANWVGVDVAGVGLPSFRDDAGEGGGWFIQAGSGGSTVLARYGKHAAGRLLDGREYNQTPESPMESEKGEERPTGRCSSCGCTELDCSGCVERTDEPCSWAGPNLCSACVPKPPKRRRNNLLAS